MDLSYGKSVDDLIAQPESGWPELVTLVRNKPIPVRVSRYYIDSKSKLDTKTKNDLDQFGKILVQVQKSGLLNKSFVEVYPDFWERILYCRESVRTTSAVNPHGASSPHNGILRKERI